MLTLTLCLNPLRPSVGRERRHVPWAGATALELIRSNWIWDEGTKVAAVVGGRAYRGDELQELIVPDGTELVLLPDPEGLETILFSIILPIVAASLIGFGVQALMGPQQVEQARRGADDDSPAYNWAGIETTYGTGYLIPLIYGHHRVGGQCLGRTLYERFERRSPTAPETFSDHLKLLFALGEGPIYAIGDTIAGAPDQVFGTPIAKGAIPGGLKVNGSEAFGEFDYAEVRAGEIHQAHLQDWLASYVTLAVGGDLPSGKHHVYVTDGTFVRQIRVRISFQGLFKSYSSGIGPYDVAFNWRYRPYNPANPGAWTGSKYAEVVTRSFRGTFTFSFVIDTWPNDPGQWEIEVWRETPDDDDTAHPETKNAQSTCVWSEVIEGSQLGVHAAPSYPGLALLSLDLQATERLSNPSPNVTVPVWGRCVAWWHETLGWQDEAFFLAGTPDRWIGRNPAWILCDFLTAKRGGLGNWFTRDNLDMPTIKAWADWCEEEIGEEPRCCCDLVVDAGRPAWEVIRDICRCGDAVPVLIGSKLSVKWERPRSRVQVFTTANMRDFQQTWVDTRTRPNLIDVQILNQEADWEQDLVSVEDPGAIGVFEPWKLGAEPTRRQTIQAPGITRPSQARRLASFQHGVNRLHDHAIRFKVGIDALAAEVGDVVGIETDVTRFFDSATQALRARAEGSATNSITLDQDLVLAPATSYQLVLVDTTGAGNVRNVTSAAGSYPAGSALTFDGDPLSFPLAAVVGFGQVDKVLREYSITRISLAEDTTAEVEAVPYDDEVFEVYQWGEDFGEPIPEVEPPAPLPPAEVLEEVQAHPLEDGTTLLTWTPPPELVGQEVRVYLRPAGVPTWDLVYQGRGAQVGVERLTPGERFEVLVVAGGIGAPGAGQPAAEAVTVIPAEFPASSPPAPGGLASRLLDYGLELRWQEGEGAAFYEVRQGPYWGGARLLARTTLPQVELAAPSGTTRYHVRAVSAGGVPSGEDTSLEVTVPLPDGLTEVLDVDLFEEV